MNTEHYFSQVMDRLKMEAEIKTDSALAGLLKMSPTAFSNRKKSGSVPYEQIIEVADSRKMDIGWIFTGHRTNESEKSPIGAKDETGYYQNTPTSPGVLDMESLEIAVECAELHLKLMKRTVSPAKFAKLIGILYDEISQDDEDEIDDNKVIRLIDLASEEDENEQEEEMADQDKKIS